MFRKLLVISDIHAAMRYVRGLRDIKRDLTVVAGDLAGCGSLDEAREVLEELASQGPPVIWVPGNCDSPDSVKLNVDNTYLVHEKVVELEGLVFVGMGGSIYTPFNTPFEYSDEYLGRKLGELLEKTKGIENSRLIVISHTPPYRSGLDLVRGGEFVGSKSLRELIEKYQPRLLFSGHIHEAPGVTNIGITLALNPGPLQRGNYAVVLVDVENNVYIVRLKRL
jgi:Icc-related predicted phosphoesterase